MNAPHVDFCACSPSIGVPPVQPATVPYPMTAPYPYSPQFPNTCGPMTFTPLLRTI